MHSGRRHRTVRNLVACAALVAAAPALAGTPAHAAVSDCAAQEVCVWTGADYSGQVTTILDEVCHDGPVGSALNGDPDTTQELRVYAQTGCAGAMAVVGPGSQSGSVSGQSYVDWHSAGSPP